ncbi:MAG: pantoate--beta-alanine ligase [Chthoniobacterales bacterium]|nr:pantoate--beta-alanine ligase [Chthoniobacterales bacterium]
MKQIHTIPALRAFRKQASHPIAFVPTMGALHIGHAALLDHARKLVGNRGTVIVSIFVNPTQFGPNEDYLKYPRTPDEDLALCRQHHADAAFLPDVASIYEPDASTYVEETSLSAGFCGASRPGHFRGVATVVVKLFNLIQPDFAIFGEKDWQQLTIIRRVVRDLFLPIRIEAVPTVREPDGLACSSRNRYLSPSERAAAPAIYKALSETAALAANGETSTAILRNHLLNLLNAIPNASTDYAEIADEQTLQVPDHILRPARALVAVRFPSARLIDNFPILPPQSHSRHSSP